MMRFMIAAIVAVSFLCDIHGITYAQNAAGVPTRTKIETRTKEEDIRRLLDLVGTGKLGAQVWGQLFPLIKKSAPSVPDNEWQAIDEEIGAEFQSGAFVERIVGLYSAHFTHEEVKQIISFYETPVGKKVINTLPQLTQEAMVMGRQWADDVVKRVYEKLRKKGYSVPTA